MRWVAMGFGAVGAVLTAAAVLLGQWAGMDGGVGKVIGMLLQYSNPTGHLVEILICFSLVVILIVAAANLARKPPAGRSEALTVLSFTPVGLGVAGAAYAGLMIRMVAAATHTTNLKVIAPSVAEAILVAALGLLVGAIAAGLNSWIAARQPAS